MLWIWHFHLNCYFSRQFDAYYLHLQSHQRYGCIGWLIQIHRNKFRSYFIIIIKRSFHIIYFLRPLQRPLAALTKPQIKTKFKINKRNLKLISPLPFLNKNASSLIWSDPLCPLLQTVKRPRKVAVHSLKPPPSPGGDSRDYAPSTHYYDADNDNGWYRNESRDHTSDVKGYLDPDYRGGRDYNHREKTRGRSQDRTSPSPDRSRREGSRGRARDTSGDQQRYHSRGRSPGGSYRAEDKYERGEGGGGRGGRYRSRDRLNDNSPSPEPSRELEPLDKPVNVLLVKNRPSEGSTHCFLFNFSERLERILGRNPFKSERQLAANSMLVQVKRKRGTFLQVCCCSLLKHALAWFTSS